mmetsp:Transcript_59715/g.194929  ORF Transcript_59715/g.194929 Transcript_59715/m.194929 type:complete len:447 (-) Transcript_59715:98-1438(-)
MQSQEARWLKPPHPLQQPLPSPPLLDARAAAVAAMAQCNTWRCTAPARSLQDRWSGFQEFAATLLDVNATGLPHGYPAPPPRGSQVELSCGSEGFILQESRSRSPGCTLVITPGTFVDSVQADQRGAQDPSAIRITALFPVWSVTLRLSSQREAQRLEQRVTELALCLTQRMQAQFTAERAVGIVEPTLREVNGTEQERDGPLVCGTYVLRTHAINRDHEFARMQPLAGPVVHCLWLELRGPIFDRITGQDTVELRYYTGHNSGSLLADVVTVGMRDFASWVPEVANNVLIVGRRDERPPAFEEEVPRLEFIAFPNDDEAAAFFDLFVATQRRDQHLANDARSRMQRCVSQRLQERQVPSGGEFECWMGELVSLSLAAPEVTPELRELREQRRLQREAEKKLVQEALGLMAEQQAQWAQDGGAGFPGSSDTVVIQASDTVAYVHKQ